MNNKNNKQQARFNRASGVEKYMEMVGTVLAADHVAAMPLHQAVEAVAIIEESVEALRLAIRQDGNLADSIKPSLKLAEEKQQKVYKGFLSNPVVAGEFCTMFNALAAQVADEADYIWDRAHRSSLEEGLDTLLVEFFKANQAFALLAQKLQRASDAVLQARGLMKVRNLWQERLKAALFPCPAPKSSRINVVPSFMDEQYGVTDEVYELSDDVAAALDSCPDYLRRFFYETGYQINVAERLIHIDNSYADMRDDDKYDRSFDASAKGVNRWYFRYIDIPAYHGIRTENGLRLDFANADFGDLAMTLAHEIFHGIDVLMGNFSDNNASIKKAYADDIADIRGARLSRKNLSYIESYLPQSYGGNRASILVARREAFAEIGAEQALGQSDNYISEFFPHTTTVMQSVLDTLKVVYAAPPGQFLLRQPIRPKAAPARKMP